MGDPLPPDPYLALGVAKDATAAAIKTQYRKLVLKFHPDKVQDESQKQVAADQFHKIQTAYEIVSDESRRARYDAQFKLSELRKDMMERDQGGRRRSSDDDRSPRYATQRDSARDYPPREREPRTSPQYSTEERRPGYAQQQPPQDYFESQPRTTSRKDADYERSSRRTPPREERTKSSKASSVGGKKKDDRSSRKEKSKKSDRDVRQDRQRKFATTVVEEDSSDSDPYERRRREMRDEDRLRKVREQYWEHERQQREQADQGYFGDERARKLFSQTSELRDHIGRSGRTPQTEEPELRPSPVRVSSSRDRTEQRRPTAARMSSSKDQVEYLKTRDGPPVMIRRGSGRPQTSSERRTREPEIVEEAAREGKRPPTLGHMKSSPPVLGPDTRQQTEKPRSHSVQLESERNEEAPVPKMRRAETMPYPKHRETIPEKGSRLRHSAYPTPETSPERQPRKFNYGQSQAYADDVEYASPDGYEVPASSSRYETEERKPQRGSSHKRDRYAEEPTVAKDSRDRQRSSSTKHSAAQPPPMPRTSSTQYVYRDGQEACVRPGPVRETSRSADLYGEIPTSRSPGVQRSRYPPPAEANYSRTFPSDTKVNMQSGFTAKERPNMYRGDTGRSRQAA